MMIVVIVLTTTVIGGPPPVVVLVRREGKPLGTGGRSRLHRRDRVHRGTVGRGIVGRDVAGRGTVGRLHGTGCGRLHRGTGGRGRLQGRGRLHRRGRLHGTGRGRLHRGLFGRGRSQPGVRGRGGRPHRGRLPRGRLHGGAPVTRKASSTSPFPPRTLNLRIWREILMRLLSPMSHSTTPRDGTREYCTVERALLDGTDAIPS